ncbi:MAG: hypothetical protein IPP47_19005 [Bryobacterales bacterium]|nr:hypothetical protein [Bryobacterales bacterium]
MAGLSNEAHSHLPYSQAGEDRIFHFLFEAIGSPRNLRYAEVGAAFSRNRGCQACWRELQQANPVQ